MKRFVPSLLLGLVACQHPARDQASPPDRVAFENVTDMAGLVSTPAWKYGGPTVADLDQDGDYDLVLTNHDSVPAQIFENIGSGRFTERPFPLARADIHGIAAGDYDKDGDLDLLVALGGGNGLAPRPPILLRNDGWTFSDVTAQSGIAHGSRGRTVRWIDIDNDGDLDIISINAVQMIGEDGPRHFVYENLGDGRFADRSDPGFQMVEAERALVSDFNGDRIPDLVLFSPLSLWRSEGDFTFTDVTRDMVPGSLGEIDNVMAAAETDIDNDGDFDIYLARGKTYYEIANNALDFDAVTGRIDLRDEGNKGRDGLSFTADGPITLTNVWHWKRVRDVALPLHLGAAARSVDAPQEPLTIEPDEAAGFPEKITEDGWYLGHLGDGEWRLEWHLSDNLAWEMRASVLGVTSVSPDFRPQERGVSDVLLRRESAVYSDASEALPPGTRDNNWGVATGDFDNNGRSDFFVYRFGHLQSRIADLLLFNGESGLEEYTHHGASSTEGHGDMGMAFDWDQDGRIDILSGDDDMGRWHLYRNRTETTYSSRSILVKVGNSPNGFDANGAVITVRAGTKRMYRKVGSEGTTHSQGLLATQHIGIGNARGIDSVTVTWRDGTAQSLDEIQPGAVLSFGTLGR